MLFKPISYRKFRVLLVEERKIIISQLVKVVEDDGVVVWKTSKKSGVARSSSEAAYMALAKCVQMVKCYKSILKSLGEQVEQTVMFEDNETCIAWAKGAESKLQNTSMSNIIYRKKHKIKELWEFYTAHQKK